MTTSGPDIERGEYVLALGDDALISAQRLGWWISRAPELEEDVALANIALDQLGQARLLLDYAGRLLGPHGDKSARSEDDLAFFRDEREFRNVHLVERDPGDFAVTMIRLLIFATHSHALYQALTASTDDTLSAIAHKAIKEVRYHVDHAAGWVVRLGDGTETSHRRALEALVAEWPYVAELFEDWVPSGLIESGFAASPSGLRQRVVDELEATLNRATLLGPDGQLPQTRAVVGGGRRGLHTEEFGYVLAEMQHVARSHPGANW